MKSYKTFLGFVWIVFYFVSAAASPLQAAIPAEERAALIALYNSTNGDGWGNNSGWKTPPLHSDGFAMPGTEYRWHGIYVPGNHVTEILLYANRLSGSIPPELGNLGNLRYLYLYNNQLSGSIPPELGNLGNLRYLYLSNNQLSGSIPPELGNLGNLVNLRLYNNQLSGSIPPELGNLGNLRYLYLYNNQLSGSIPPELGNLDNLNYLVLSANRLTGGIPPELGNLGNLEGLFLSANRLSGSIPFELVNLRNLGNNRSDIGYNGLYTDNSSLRSFLNFIDNDWATTQTITPSYVSASATFTSSILLSWTPIYYTSHSGGYRIYYSTTSGGPWIYAGMTENKSIASCEITDLNPGTTYYFVIKTRTNPHTINANTVDSEYSEEVSEITSGIGNNTLTVRSSPNTGANISVTPEDNNGNGNGTTNFTRTYNGGTSVTLTAPTTLRGRIFSKWTVDGADNSNRTIQITINGSHTVTAVYKPLTSTYDLTVQSYPDTGVNITVTPDDNSGNGNGAANFSRTYDKGTPVTLTAPASHNGKKFSGWTVDQSESSSLSIQVSMNSDHTVTANYASPTPHLIDLNRTRLNFAYIIGAGVTGSQTLAVNCIGGTLNWTASVDVPWLDITPPSASGSGKTSISVNTSAPGLSAGTYIGTIVVTAPGAVNCPLTVQVLLKVFEPGTTAPPIGEFASPENGAAVYGSIPVSGWVLDDIGIENVKIYREGEDGYLAYIGDAVFIEGARPDVEQAYPDYPMNYRAGWGYMMLTNFLPNKGNGTFNIHAIAATTEGERVTLGIKTIHCDNANAVKPFGAIDTPEQGGTASGANFINWGWALTPQPNTIPTDGSTIDVYVDGVNLGHPFYNIYRYDIAASFPGYSNSDGAAGYFYLDTTAYENGMHMIQWTVTDSSGNCDGIGSRYFTVYNTENLQAKAQAENYIGNTPVKRYFHLLQRSGIPTNNVDALRIGKGFGDGIEPEVVACDGSGVYKIKTEPSERLVIEFSRKSSLIEGYTVIGDRLGPLPIGSKLDTKTGRYSWQPGPGFAGYYRLVFIEKSEDKRIRKINISVEIEPEVAR